ncbi:MULTISPECIES: Crp/Fnr family transcriptional regulator [Arcicella]|uniref:Crp/Fnr family transcriptional regulator n=1 Tax=Arcicella aquatica TaxID=217141 RepID=A0ABU5QU28_9BACT|nr:MULTISPECIES: Crp/Fnr family transcriptional regulator [Arcicella]MDR6564654.1 CRP-like cAMP-binding protein [Arcicella sp. BE51]MDR6814418.1 CRP-like cAMP-binding protein [Arcicella sp. BE140]MDR6825826.1 CRP-like cAMP-binding protein [Arcicella sp. BE139]MEA5260611.1 Crp/Fnr family transcriptional regulator [Arcicella aquatica]
MYKNLLAYINQYANLPLTSEEESLIEATFQPKKLRKKQYFLQEGDVCKYVGFIVKGAMRQYSVDDKGVEHIVHLYIENYWAGDRESSIMLTPSNYNIDAWEDTEMLIITRAEMLDLMEKIPALVKMIRLMDERNAIANQRRLSSTISNTAEKRYEEFADNHPQFIQRFPQHIIASYLGITKETLSRIRKQAMK